MTEHYFEMLFDSLAKAYYLYTQQHMYYAFTFAIVTIILACILLYKCYDSMRKLTSAQDFVAMAHVIFIVFGMLWIFHMLSSIHDMLIYGVFYNIHL